ERPCHAHRHAGVARLRLAPCDVGAGSRFLPRLRNVGGATCPQHKMPTAATMGRGNDLSGSQERDGVARPTGTKSRALVTPVARAEGDSPLTQVGGESPDMTPSGRAVTPPFAIAQVARLRGLPGP